MARVTNIFPVFKVDNLANALEYYRAKLGFTVAWTWGDPIDRAGVALDDIEIQLDGGGLGAPRGSSVVYCHMTDVDSYFEACRARGANVTMPIADRPWGMRDFRVLDLDGNQLGFGEKL